MSSEWKYETMTTQFHKEKDADIIAEAKRRKKECGATISKTIREWVRLGFKAEQEASKQ